MNQADLIQDIANRTGLPKKAVGDVLAALGDAAQGELAAGGEIPLPGLGKIKAEMRAAREGRNPATGAAMTIPAKAAAKFSATKALKDALNP